MPNAETQGPCRDLEDQRESIFGKQLCRSENSDFQVRRSQEVLSSGRLRSGRDGQSRLRQRFARGKRSPVEF